MSKTPVRGSCLCGTVRFRVRLPTILCAHCHCSICRRSHGAAFVTWFAVEREALTLDGGRESLVRFTSSSHAFRSFCGRCGSALFTESSLHRPDQIDIVLANMEEPIDREPGLHVFYDDRVEWFHVGDDLPRLGGPSGLEPLTAESD